MNVDKHFFEVIVIGAGPSGLAAAKVLADNNIETLVIEKSIKPSRNFYSGIISEELIKEIFPGFNDPSGKILAPFERFVDQYRAYILDENTFTSYNMQNPGHNCYLVLREAFAGWQIKELEKSGASVIKGQPVRELIINNGIIKGVKTADNEYYSKVVIVAEGASSVLTKKAGLRTGELQISEVFIFAEENIELPPKIIEERFNLLPFNGIAAKLFTQKMFGMPSIGYIYTNHSSVLLGIGLLLSESIGYELNINSALEKLKEHSCIKPLIQKGTVTHYNSYVLPAGSPKKERFLNLKLYAPGCLLAGACSSMIDLSEWDLSTAAMLSGKAAAWTVIKAKEVNDFSAKSLSYYSKILTEDILPKMITHNLAQNDNEFKFEVQKPGVK